MYDVVAHDQVNILVNGAGASMVSRNRAIWELPERRGPLEWVATANPLAEAGIKGYRTVAQIIMGAPFFA